MRISRISRPNTVCLCSQSLDEGKEENESGNDGCKGERAEVNRIQSGEKDSE